MRYDFDAKQSEYRAPLWAMVDGMIRKPLALRTVAYLDTALALETRHLLALGYAPEKLHPINRSAAQLAGLTLSLKKAKLGPVNTRGHCGNFHEICCDLLDAGIKPEVLSFDGCGTVDSDELWGKKQLMQAVLLCQPKVVTLTLLAGRDGRAMEDLEAMEKRATTAVAFDSLNKPQSSRLYHRLKLAMASVTALDGDCHTHVKEMKWAGYVSSSGQAMGYAVARVEAHDDRTMHKPCALLPFCIIDGSIRKNSNIEIVAQIAARVAAR